MGWVLLKDLGAVDLNGGEPVVLDVAVQSSLRGALRRHWNTSEEIARPFLVVGTSQLEG